MFMTFFEALKKYIESLKLSVKPITAERYIGDVRRFCLFLKNPLLHKVTDEQVIEYLRLHQDLGWKHNGIVTMCCELRSFFKFAFKHGWIRFNPELIPIMKKEYAMPRVANEEDYRKVLSVIGDRKYVEIRDKAIIMLLWDTGARNGEIVSLNEKDLDLPKMKAVIKTEKSRGMKPFREIYWTEETHKALKAWLKKKHELESKIYIEQPEALFWGSTQNWQGKRLSNHGICLALRRYSNRAKVPCLNPHSFRHHMGHDLNDKGANNSIISSILGHANLSSSFIYSELNNKEREKAYEKFKRGGNV